MPATTTLRILTADDVVQQLRALRTRQPVTYSAFYSSQLGGIVTDPGLMIIPFDDHMVHRGHGIFDTAGIVNGPAGLVSVTAIDKATLQHRFTRQLTLGTHVVGLNALDADRSGIIYLGTIIEAPTSTPEVPAFAVTLLCLDPLDGRPGREAGALDREQLEALCERTLGRPRRRRPRNAPVDEHEPLHRRDSSRVTNSAVFRSE